MSVQTAPAPSVDDTQAETPAELSTRLLDSSERLSYDPAEEVDWDAPLDPHLYGLNPEWSTLYGTPLWDEMTEQQRVALTRHEVTSIMSTGIWFEMILQQMVLRDLYASDVSRPTFRFALTEIADECRHSIMFARVCDRLGITAYKPGRLSLLLGRGFKTLAADEVAYGGILVAEEVLDVMQRDWMRGEDVLPMVRTTSRIHVVEESRHMTFARSQMKQHLATKSRYERYVGSIVIAIGAYVIVSNMVNDGVYAAVGLDPERAKAEAAANAHHHALMRTSSTHLISFLGECGLLTRPAAAIFARLHML